MRKHGDGIAIKNAKGKNADVYSSGERDQLRKRYLMLKNMR